MNSSMNLDDKLNNLNWLLKNLYKMFCLTGFWGVLTKKPILKPLFFILKKFRIDLKSKYLKLNLKGYEHPVWFRYGASDMDAFSQIFLNEEYACLNDLQEPKLIIDCGANVGYSSVYFLNKHPKAYVIAVEPDDQNFKVCEKNLLPYSERVSLIYSGIWSHKTGLTVCREEYGDNKEWATQVKECQEEQAPDIHSISINDLLENIEFRDIDILKIDIEGSEAVVFSQNYETWLNKVKNIVIELHGKECEQVFFKALSTYNYDLSQSYELTVCKEIKPKATYVNCTN